MILHLSKVVGPGTGGDGAAGHDLSSVTGGTIDGAPAALTPPPEYEQWLRENMPPNLYAALQSDRQHQQKMLTEALRHENALRRIRRIVTASVGEYIGDPEQGLTDLESDNLCK
jgi:hypothetical protein